MGITDFPRAVLRFQYRVARMPLQLVEDRVLARMDDEAPARLAYERALGAVDGVVGHALGDSALKMQGDAMATRSKALSRAATLAADAATQREAAAEDLSQQAREAAARKDEARANKLDEARDARSAAARRKKQAIEDVAERVDTAKQRADQSAARKRQSVDAATEREKSRIGAVEGAKLAAADAELRDAADKRKGAAAKRLDADHLDDLAEAEKNG